MKRPVEVVSSWGRRHPLWVAVLAGVLAAGACWTWRDRQRAKADAVEIAWLEGAGDLACDDLANDLGLVAGALERHENDGGRFDEDLLSIGSDHGLVGAGHLSSQWYARFLTCIFPRDLPEKDKSAAISAFRADTERVQSERGDLPAENWAIRC
jgi:hypothetical protein